MRIFLFIFISAFISLKSESFRFNEEACFSIDRPLGSILEKNDYQVVLSFDISYKTPETLIIQYYKSSDDFNWIWKSNFSKYQIDLSDGVYLSNIFDYSLEEEQKILSEQKEFPLVPLFYERKKELEIYSKIMSYLKRLWGSYMKGNSYLFCHKYDCPALIKHSSGSNTIQKIFIANRDKLLISDGDIDDYNYSERSRKYKWRSMHDYFTYKSYYSILPASRTKGRFLLTYITAVQHKLSGQKRINFEKEIHPNPKKYLESFKELSSCREIE